MKVKYEVVITYGLDERVSKPDANTPTAYGFLITRISKPAPDVVVHEPFQGNGGCCMYDSAEEAIAAAQERIATDKARRKEDTDERSTES